MTTLDIKLLSLEIEIVIIRYSLDIRESIYEI